MWPCLPLSVEACLEGTRRRYAAKAVGALEPFVEVSVKVFLMVPVVRQCGVDLPQGELRVLEVLLRGAPSVRLVVQDELVDLDGRALDDRHAVLAKGQHSTHLK